MAGLFNTLISKLFASSNTKEEKPDDGEAKVKEASSKTIQEIDREKLDNKFSKKDKEKLN